MRAHRGGALLLALGACAPLPLAAQLIVDVSAGARYSTPLVRDVIVTPFTARPAVAPAVAVTLGTPLEHGWVAQVTLDFSTSELQRHDVDGATFGFGRLSTAAVTVGVQRALPAGFTARIGAGGLKYFPGERSGMFRRGSGAIAGLGSLAVARTLPAGRRYRVAVEVRYDVHGFTTPALREEGFESARAVHRVAVVLRAGARAAR